MGCFVLKSTYTSYIAELQTLTKKAEELEDELPLRTCLNNLHAIDPSDSLPYLHYQEQCRANQFFKTLSKIMKTPEKDFSGPNQDNPGGLFTPSDYFERRLKQTEHIESFTEKFTEISKKLEEIHKTKTQEFTSRLDSLIEFIKEKVQRPEPKIEEIKEDFSCIESFSSLNELTQGLVKLSELQKELEILQRKYDFKQYLMMQEAKNREKEAMRGRIEEIKVHIEKLNSNWADMKDDQRRKAEELQNLQDSIAKNKLKIQQLTETQKALIQTLKQYGDNVQGYDEILEELNEKTRNLENLLQEVQEINENIADHSHVHSEMDALKKRKSFLAVEVGELNTQINLLLDQQRANEESVKKEEEMKQRLAKIEELKQKIQLKEENMQNINEIYTNGLKKQVSQNIVLRFKQLPKTYLMKWSMLASLASDKQSEPTERRNSINQVMTKIKTDDLWEKSMFLNFFIRFMTQKYKEDEQAINENKPPMPVHEYLEAFMKKHYNNDWEVECKMMLNLISSEPNDDLFNMMKSLVGLSKDPFSYTFSLFFAEAVHYFETNKTSGKETMGFENVFTLAESFCGKKREVLIPVLYKMKAEGMTDEKFVLNMLKLKLAQLGRDFTDYCDSADSFMDVVRNDFELLVDDEVLQVFKENCETEFDMNFDMKINYSVKSLSSAQFQVNRQTFLKAFVEVYKDCLARDAQSLEQLVSRFEVINKEVFARLVNQIAPDLNAEMISGLFNEASSEAADSLLKPADFLKIVLKYAIGGFGVGPFRSAKLRGIAGTLLNTVFRSRKSEETKKVIKSTDIPIRIFQSTETMTFSAVSSKIRPPRSGSVDKSSSSARKWISPMPKPEKNPCKDLPKSPRYSNRK